MHLYTHTCVRMHMHTYAQIENLSNNASTCQAISLTNIRIHMHIHAYTHIYTYIHMCTACSECVADVYVGVKTHLCNIHTHSCTSAQNTCKVHVTLTAKKCTYIYTYTHMHTHTYAHENTCACMTPSTR